MSLVVKPLGLYTVYNNNYLNKGAVAGFLPTTESNLRTALGVEICKLAFANRFQRSFQICVARCVFVVT